MIKLETLVEVKLKTDEDFLKVRETLTRIGVASKKEKKLYQSCHILHKQGLYYIVHFKELFALDNKPSNFSEEDIYSNISYTYNKEMKVYEALGEKYTFYLYIIKEL